MCYYDETYYEDERKIQDSGVRDIFTPHTPIDQESLFKGDELKYNKFYQH